MTRNGSAADWFTQTSSSCSSVPQKIFLSVPSTLPSLAAVLAWFEQLSPLVGDGRDWEKCRIALAEGFTNAVKHAHSHLPSETLVELEASCDEDAVEILIWDQGYPFDLSTYLEMLPPHESAQAESGRGLRLIREIADSFSYRRSANQRNCLRIYKRISESSLSASGSEGQPNSLVLP